MLPTRARNTRSELTLLLKTGTRTNGRLFTYISKPDETTKVSVIVSKRVAKTAVARHRIRRRAYEAVREILPPLRLALIAKQGVGTASFAMIRTEIAQNVSSKV